MKAADSVKIWNFKLKKYRQIQKLIIHSSTNHRKYRLNVGHGNFFFPVMQGKRKWCEGLVMQQIVVWPNNRIFGLVMAEYSAYSAAEY